MEETGKYIIQQVPKIAEFHSVVMTTFSFDFHFFESQVLRLLKQKGVTSFNVMVDTSMLDKSIGFSTGHLKDICNHYSVHSVPCVGAFHPKIIFLAGKDDIIDVYKRQILVILQQVLRLSEKLQGFIAGYFSYGQEPGEW